MDSLLRKLRNFGKKAVRSVAFLPVPMIVLSILLGFVLFWVENGTDISRRTADAFPALAITSQDTARAILSMFIGGLITLTVFTFSQIMILLNQVAGSYGPRLLPKLTGDRSLQFVMGLNLSTIVLSITVLISIRSDDDYRIPNFSIILCTVLGILCLCLFVYFVTDVTRKIHVSSIIDSTTRDSLKRLKKEWTYERQGYAEHHLPDDADDWYAISAPISGYIGTVDHESLSRLAGKLNTRFYIGTSKGQFVPKGLPLLQSEKRLDEKQVNKVIKAVSPIHERFDDWYLPNLKQLTEIALRALSPGINDPGTALTVIDRQTQIMAKLMTTPLHNYYRDTEQDGGEVWFARHDYHEVLAALMQEMRRYGKTDPLVTRQLFQMLFHLLRICEDTLYYRRHIQREIQALLHDANASLTNPHDRRLLARDLMHHRRGLRRAHYLAPRRQPSAYHVRKELQDTKRD